MWSRGTRRGRSSTTCRASSVTPLSEQGTSLALVGAYVLAGFEQYERRMRGYVTLNQALATENPGGPPSEESAERAKSAADLDTAGL